MGRFDLLKHCGQRPLYDTGDSKGNGQDEATITAKMKRKATLPTWFGTSFSVNVGFGGNELVYKLVQGENIRGATNICLRMIICYPTSTKSPFSCSISSLYQEISNARLH